MCELTPGPWPMKTPVVAILTRLANGNSILLTCVMPQAQIEVSVCLVCTCYHHVPPIRIRNQVVKQKRFILNKQVFFLNQV